MSVSTSIYSYATTSTAKAYLGGDEKADLAPSVSSTYDVRSDDWNKIVSGLVECGLRTRYGTPCNYMFSQANCTASQTAVELARSSAGDAALTEVVAIASGYIVGLAVFCENQCSAGTLAIKVEINGTPTTISVGLESVTNKQKNYTRQTPVAAAAAATPDTFSAGDTIEVTVTTNGTWAAGSTPSISVDLYLHYGD